jgi:transposase
MDAIVVGIDVSKDRLDVAVRLTGETFAVERDADGLSRLIAPLAPLAPQAIAVEATGGCETVVAARLLAAGLPVVVVNLAQVRAFAKALGKRAKTDPIDAAVIVHFVEAAKPDIRPMPDEKTRLLPDLVARRAQIVQMIAADRQRQKRLIGKRLQKSIAVCSPRCRRGSPASRPTSTRRCAARRPGGRTRTCSPPCQALGRPSPAP